MYRVLTCLTTEHDAFAAAVKPLLDEAQGMYGRELFELVDVRA